MVTFEELIPDQTLRRAIRDLGFVEPTEIQAKTIPLGLDGKDVIGQAKTGSGKTLAFGVPLLSKLTAHRTPQALILAPTRELCQQIAHELGRLARHSDVKVAAIFGGVAFNPQYAALRDSQVVVATPGRLLDLMGQGALKTAAIKLLVFDEADRMFDMGFVKDMERIVNQLPKERQTMLFSATMPDAIKRLASKHQHHPVHVTTGTHIEHHLLPQYFYRTDSAGKYSLLVHLLKKEDPHLAIIFCKTKHGARSLARNLSKLGFAADAIQGNLSQNQRDRVIAEFKTGKVRFLVATDVASRGLDVKHVSHVFNYNIPSVPDDYVHRIGRTARAGASGKAITLVEPEDRDFWRDILRLPHVSALELKADGVEPLAFQKHDRGQRAPQRRSQRAPRQAGDRAQHPARRGQSPRVHGERGGHSGRPRQRSGSGHSSPGGSSSGGAHSGSSPGGHGGAGGARPFHGQRPRRFPRR